MKRKAFVYLLTFLLLCTNMNDVLAFCGFYVAKADAKLFNESSKVIICRDGDQTTITMSNDYQGEVEDFAMVVPVPVVLKESDIRVVDQMLFDRLDAYSAPRLVKYYDSNPCDRHYYDDMAEESAAAEEAPATEGAEAPGEEDPYKVTIEAKYTVGEYDILILSAEESSGLEKWLIDNGYKIPDGAEEVLAPYIKDKLKFFVVKVNVKEKKKAGFDTLRPLQIKFTSDKFMLPIRLGMANAKSDQDLVVFAFTRTGRVETANYRTVEIPSNINIPTNIEPKFGQFYVDLFKTAWEKEGKNACFVEYAWDISSTNYLKCDPCVGDPPNGHDLREAGASWLSGINDGQEGMQTANYQGNIFVTRLHIRYNRKTFPQDLTFQITPNTNNFQGRYIMQFPATGDLTCKEATSYLGQLTRRRRAEVKTLAELTGWDTADYEGYVNEYQSVAKKASRQYMLKVFLFAALFIGILIALFKMLGFQKTRI